MKRLSLCLLVAVSSLILATGTFAQDNHKSWADRMRSEKIGFLTSFIDLSQKEAQAFWPIYNKAEKESNEAMEANFHAYRALQRVIKEGKSEEEVEKCLREYLKAAQNAETAHIKYAKEYEKILSPVKVAKLFVAEEEFRRQQIMKLPQQQSPRFGRNNQNNQNKQ